MPWNIQVLIWLSHSDYKKKISLSYPLHQRCIRQHGDSRESHSHWNPTFSEGKTTSKQMVLHQQPVPASETMLLSGGLWPEQPDTRTCCGCAFVFTQKLLVRHIFFFSVLHIDCAYCWRAEKQRHCREQGHVLSVNTSGHNRLGMQCEMLFFFFFFLNLTLDIFAFIRVF